MIGTAGRARGVVMSPLRLHRRSFETPAGDELSTSDATATILRIAASNGMFGGSLAAAWIVGQAVAVACHHISQH